MLIPQLSLGCWSTLLVLSVRICVYSHVRYLKDRRGFQLCKLKPVRKCPENAFFLMPTVYMCILKKYVHKCRVCACAQAHMYVYIWECIHVYTYKCKCVHVSVCLQLNIYIRIKFIAINFPLTARQYLAVDAPSILSFTALQSCLSCYVSCECSSVQKTKLRKTIQAKTSCYSAWVYFQYLLSFFFSSSLRFMLFPPPNLELIMSVCMAFVTLVESCSDSRRPCWREGEEEAPAAGCRELPVTTSCVVRISELCVTCCFSLRVWM